MSNDHPRAGLEACVTTVASARAAEAGGADRLELCVALDRDGLTPPPDLVREVRRAVSVPVVVLVRIRDVMLVRPGDPAAIAAGVRMAREHGADGVAVGGIRLGALDAELLASAVQAAGTLPVTVHRAFDHAPDRLEALEAARASGAARILTSGGVGSAGRHLRALADTVRAAGDLDVVVAGGITAANVRQVLRATGARWVHAHGGLVGPDGEVSADRVRGMVRALAPG